MTYRQYTVHLKHDSGKISLKLLSDSISNAIKAIITYKNCPKNAIYKIEVKDLSHD